MTEQLSTFGIVLTSTVIASAISAFVATWISERKIGIENITKERKKWRDKVRIKALEVHDAMVDRDEKRIRQLKVEFRVMLNPREICCNHDHRIIESIRLPEEGENEVLRCSDQFSKEVSFLLKHDWERAKLEASNVFYRLIRAFFGIKPKREIPKKPHNPCIHSDL